MNHTAKVDILAKKIWDYMLMRHQMKKMDAIFILGSNDIRVASRAAEVYKEGYAPYIICSGGNGKDSIFIKPEAEVFAEALVRVGIPEQKIILEQNATNTGENILFTKKLLEEKGFNFNSFILVQKPYMERRTYATFCKQWPEAECVVTSPKISYEDYTDNNDSKNKFIDVMVGDLQRIKEYPKLGYQIEQEIPEDVLKAWEELVSLGFKKYFLYPQ